jgi:hypothetical protein
MKNRSRRGHSLSEVLVSAALGSIALTGGVACYLAGMMSWTKGEGAIDSISSSQDAIRFISQELREAISASVNSAGTQLTYQLPRKNANGNFVLPIQSDGVNRMFRVHEGQLLHVVGNQSRVISNHVLATDPVSGLSYRNFTPDNSTIARQVMVHLAISRPGYRENWQPSRARECVYLRNIPQLTR